MPVMDATFATFFDGGDLELDDIVVGLRNGVNTRFSYTASPGIYLPLAGGTMAGTIDMDGNTLTGVPTPNASTDAVNKAYADALTAGAALTRANDTNVTLTLGGTPLTSLLQAVSLTLGWSGQLAVSRGGSGNSTFTAYSVLCAGTTATGAFQNVSGVGSTNQVLVSNGAAALPSWQSVPGLSASALTKVDDTNVTLSLGGTPATSLLQAVSLTLGWSGQLSLARGGSNANLTAVNGGIVYSNSTAMAISAAGSSGQLLQSAGATTPVWTTATYPATAGSSGNFMQSNGTNWLSATPAALTKADDTNVTLTLGGTPASSLMQAVSLTLGWTGQLALTRGGTNASLTASNGGIVWSDATKLNILSGTVTANQLLVSGSSATPAWSGLSSLIDTVIGGTQGNILYRNASAWTVLAPGTSGNFLQTQGAAANPQWAVAGSGTVSSGTINQLAWYAATGTAVSGLSTANSGVLVTSAGGVPSISTTLPSGLTIPGYAHSGANADITSMTGLTGGLRAPTAILDANGNNVVSFSSTASAVNYLQLTNSASSNPVDIAALGTATNLTITMTGKGSGGVLVRSSSASTTPFGIGNGSFNFTHSIPTMTTDRTLTYPDGNVTLTAGTTIVSGGALGTPSSGTLSNCTGLPISTGVSGLASGIATFLGTPSSANLAAALTDETGTGAAVFANTPTLVTPNLGVASATSINFGGTALSTYVEGTWTPTDASGAGLVLTINSAKYTQIGRVIYIQAYIVYPVTASGATALIGGLPVAVPANGFGTAAVETGTVNVVYMSFRPGSNNVQPFKALDTVVTNVNMSGGFLIFTGFYFAT